MSSRLNDWPRPATYAACILLGFALPHLQVLDFRYETLPDKTFFVAPPPTVPLDKPLVMVSKKQSPWCRPTALPWRHFQAGPTPLIGLPLKKDKGVALALALLTDRHTRFVAASKGRDLPLCAKDPKVTYESP